MRRTLFTCLALCALSSPHSADTNLRQRRPVRGHHAVFADDRTRRPGLALNDGPRDGVTFGGGGRIGAFSRHRGASSSVWTSARGSTMSVRSRFACRFDWPCRLPRCSINREHGHRFTASSVLLGYHPPVRGRDPAGLSRRREFHVLGTNVHQCRDEPDISAQRCRGSCRCCR